jgi:oligo-1,6-glucosidase
MDVINLLVKPAGLPNAPAGRGYSGEPYVFAPDFYANQPGIHQLLQEMNRELFRHYDIVTIGECTRVDPQIGPDFTAADRHELNLVFQFDILRSRKDAATIRRMVGDWYESYRGRAWNCVTLSNHDSPRQLSIYGDEGQYRKESAKLIATFLLTTPGTPFLYQGEEIGMANVTFPRIEDYRDIEMINRFRILTAEGLSPQAALDELQRLSRDNSRTPMQWSTAPNAGFTDGEPWMGVNPDFTEINVEDQLNDPDSVFHYYRRLIAYRKQHPDLIYGEYRAVENSGLDPDLYIYSRTGLEKTYWVLLNWGPNPQDFSLPVNEASRLIPAIGNYPSDQGGQLRPWECRVYEMSET